MATRINRLLIRKRPQADESLWGYLIRLTEDNCYEDVSWILSLAGMKGNNHAGVSSRYFFNPESNPSNLSELTGITLMSMMYLPVNPQRSSKGHVFFGNPAPRRMIRVFSPKICTKCLAESNYIRRIWDYVLLTACPIHYCLLITTCQKCQRKIGARRCKVSECDCGFDWRDSTPTVLKADDLRLANRIYQLCGQTDVRLTPQLQRNHLATVDLAELSRRIHLVIVLKRVTDNQTWGPVRKSGIELFHEILNKSVAYFDR